LLYNANKSIVLLFLPIEMAGGGLSARLRECTLELLVYTFFPWGDLLLLFILTVVGV
jgi:hypothetical protein